MRCLRCYYPLTKCNYRSTNQIAAFNHVTSTNQIPRIKSRDIIKPTSGCFNFSQITVFREHFYPEIFKGSFNHHIQNEKELCLGGDV